MKHLNNEQHSRNIRERSPEPISMIRVLKWTLSRSTAWLCFAMVTAIAGPAAMADVLVDIAASNGVVKPGGSSVIEVTVANNGSQPVVSLEASVVVPAGLNAIAEGFILGVNAVSCGGTGSGSGISCTAGERIVWAVDQINPGQSRTWRFPITVAAATATESEIDWLVEVDDGVDVLATASTSIVVDTNAVMLLTIDESDDIVAPDELVSYAIHVGNTETSNFTGGALSFTLAPDTSFVSATNGGVLIGDTVEWNLATLSAGVSEKFEVQVQVNVGVANGNVLPVSAELTGNVNFSTSEQRTQETGHVGVTSTIVTELKINASPAAPGEQFVVSLNVSNAGQAPVSDIRMLMPTPTFLNGIAEGFATGENPVSCGGSGSGSGLVCTANEYLIWDFESLVPGEGREVEFPVSAAAVTALGTLIDFDVRTTDASGVSFWESQTVPISNNAVATLAIDEDKDPVAPGELLTYVVSYGNKDSSNITNAQLRIKLPANTTLVSATGGGQSGMGVVSWSLGTLVTGTHGQQTVQVEVDSDVNFGTQLPVEAELTGTANFLSTVRRVKESAYVRNAPLIATQLKINAAPAAAGEQVTLSLNVSNTDILPVSDVQLVMIMPVGVNAVAEAFTTRENPISCGGSGSGSGLSCTTNEVMIWDFDSLAPGEGLEFEFPVTISSTTAEGSLIDWDVRTTDGSGSESWESQTLPVDNNAIADIAIDEDKDPVAPGELLGYTLNYGNTESNNITNTELVFTLPPHATLVSATGGGVVHDGAVSWSLGTLVPGIVGQRHVQVLIDDGVGAGTLLPVTAEITGTATFRPTTRRAQEAVYVGGAPVISADLKVSASPAAPGEQVMISLNATNTSPFPVADVQLVMNIPTGSAAVAEAFATGENPGSCGGTGSGSGLSCTTNEFIFWDFESLAPGEGVEVSFPVTVAGTAESGSMIDWDLRITDGSGAESWESQTLPVNNNAVATIAIDEDKDPVAAGDLLTYKIRYGNTDTSNITNTQLKLTIPGATEFVSASGSATVTDSTVSWSLGTLPAGLVGQQIVQVRVDSGASNGTLLPVSSTLSGTANFLETARYTEEAGYVGASGALAATLRVVPVTAIPGDMLDITMTLTNTSGQVVSDAFVSLQYPEFMNAVSELTITGGVNPGSCGGGGSGSGLSCTTNEFVFWNFDTIGPGETRILTLPPVVGALSDFGQLVKWSMLVRDGNGVESFEEATLLIGNDVAGDTDLDSIGDSFDNCVTVENFDQNDTDNDGFGNACDADVNNDCIVNFIDISQFTPRFNSAVGDPLYDPNFDIDGSGSLNFVDYVAFTSGFQMPPGPSANICIPND